MLLLETLPKTRAHYVYADYIELLCIANIDRQVSKSDLIDRINDRGNVGESAPRDLEDDDDDADTQDLFDAVSADTEKYEPSARNSKDERFIEDVFYLLEYRQATYGEAYPFHFSKKKNALLLSEKPDARQRLYIYLLICSNLSRVPKALYYDLTHTFEVICVGKMKSLLPVNSKVEIFRSNNFYTSNIFSGNLWERLGQLAREFRERVLAKETDYLDNGDGGVDIIAWVPNAKGDLGRGEIRFFGQSACTEKWIDKQSSVLPEKWRHRLTLSVIPLPLVFIPFCFRNANGEWYSDRDLSACMIVDRQRFFIDDLEVQSKALERINEIIDLVLNTNESII